MKKELINKLKHFLHKESNRVLIGTPPTDDEILEAEKQLGVKFCDDYTTFIKLFGGAYAGLAIHAFSNGRAIGKETVIELTNNLRKSHPEINDTYVISDDGAGNPIMIDKLGQVLIYDHDSGESEILAPSLGDYIEEVFEPW